MDRVFAGGIAPSMAASVAARAIIELLARDGLLNADDILGAVGEGMRQTWAEIVSEAIHDTQSDPYPWRDAQLGPLFSVLGSESSFLEGQVSFDSMLQRPDIQYVVSQAFAYRVTEWYVGLAGHDLEAALRADLPTTNLFVALPGRETRQVGGLWIWERFTITETEFWSTSSLLQEWQWTRGGITDVCDRRVLSERVISSEEITESAMRAFASEDDNPVGSEMFRPRNYVKAASNHLAVGEWERASKIFAGIVELRPGDGEAWNNLGFCQLGVSAAIALPMLRRGAALLRHVPVIFIANQVLALHLLGRDEEALELAASDLGESYEGDLSATVWMHPVGEGELELGQVPAASDYLEGLVAHIGEGNCDSRGNDHLVAEES